MGTQYRVGVSLTLQNAGLRPPRGYCTYVFSCRDFRCRNRRDYTRPMRNVPRLLNVVGKEFGRLLPRAVVTVV